MKLSEMDAEYDKDHPPPQDTCDPCRRSVTPVTPFRDPQVTIRHPSKNWHLAIVETEDGYGEYQKVYDDGTVEVL